jgi:protoporphyrin/coproporphyrin ferrochelatase
VQTTECDSATTSLCFAKMMTGTTDGVLIVAHGTVTDLSEMEGFLTAIRRGRRPSAELVREMCQRYGAIGGSPLLTTTIEQARALSDKIEKPVLVGMRFGQPSIEQALAEAARLSLRNLVVLPMAPYNGGLYVAEVQARRREITASESAMPRLLTVPDWGSHPGLIEAHVARIRGSAFELLARGAALVLSAHSLPMRVIEDGDRYADAVRQGADAIGAALGVDVELAFQSQGADGGRWLGPDLSEVVGRLAANRRFQVVVAPFGFLCDHVETLFDLDIELCRYARTVGVEICRVPALGSHPKLIETLAVLVENALTAPNDVPLIHEVHPC